MVFGSQAKEHPKSTVRSDCATQAEVCVSAGREFSGRLFVEMSE